MVRKSVSLLASLALLSPAVANALGFGGLQVQSALNEPLNAQIELVGATPQDLANLSVSLASHEAYNRAGIERSATLMLLQFEVKQPTGDTPYIQITSRQPIREPFLNFLLDMNWANGRMLREYTVLLDPPTLVRAPAPVVQAPVSTPAPAIARAEPAIVAEPATPYSEPAVPYSESVGFEPVPAPAVAEYSEPSRVDAPASPAAFGDAVADPFNMPAETPLAAADDDAELFPRIPIPEERAAPAATTVAASAPAARAPVTEHHTRRNDTLSHIAGKMRPSADVSVHQVMIALQRANPAAFDGDNINRLKAGHVLRLAHEDLAAVGRNEAVREYQRQVREWEEQRAQTAGRSPAGAVGQATEERAELKLVAPQAPGSADEGAGAGSERADTAEALRNQLSLAIEEAETERQRSAELAERLAELESQISTMQRLISLKDDELAALQQKLGEEGVQFPYTEVADSAPQEPRVEHPVVDEAPIEERPVVAPPAVPAATQTAPAADPASAPAPRSFVDNMLLVASGLLATLMASPVLMAVAGVGVLTLLLLVALIVRRRRKTGFRESILMGTAAVAGADGAAAAGKPSEQSSFLSDFAISGMGAIQSEDSEVDPLTEADVYMAYGRYPQAVELLNDALRAQPGRQELMFKRLEVYHAMKDNTAFEAAAQELHAAMGGQPSGAAWDKVVGMGKELGLASALFAGAAGAYAGVGSSSVSESQVMDIGLDTGIFQVDDLNIPAADSQAGGESAFDLDFGTEPAVSASDESAPMQAEKGELDFNLDFELPGEQATNPAEEAEPASGLDFSMDFSTGDQQDDTGLDFSLDMGGDANDSAGDLSTLEATLGSMDFDGAGAADGSQVEMDSDPLAELVDLDDPQAAGPLDFDAGDGDLDFGLSSDIDEVGTKLDLARAYIDMGDPDGARSILDEVMEEGDQGQKQEAQDLIRQIG